MALVRTHQITEKGLNQAYCGNGGSNSLGQKLSDMANWASNKVTKRESKHQTQSGYSMAYTETECYSQVNYQNHDMGFGMTDIPDKYGHGHKPHGYGFGSHSGNGMAQIQACGNGYGSGNHTSPRKHQDQAFGYGYGSAPVNHQQNGTGHGFDYQRPEAYGHKENHKNNGMAQLQQCHIGKQSVEGNRLMKNQAYGPKKNMGYGVTETETSVYTKTETHYNGRARGNGSACFGQAGCSATCNGMNCRGMHKKKGDHSAPGLLRKIKDGISRNDSSDSDDDDFARRKVWVSKAL